MQGIYSYRMKNFLITISFFLFPLFVIGQKATIVGKLVDKSTGEALIGASVMLDSISDNQGTTTDIDGNYQFTVAAGSHKLTFSYISYATEAIQVQVKAGEIVQADFAMESEVNELSEVVITYTAEKSGSVALLIARRNAAQVSDGISADLIRRTPDRTTSDVLRRITGASIQEGKFAIIRGMNDRYNAGYLDGALLPSTESDRKAFAFDVVPAALLDNVQIIKSGTPDLTGDFGGGIIKINTKAVPETFTQTLSVGGQTHSLTSFKPFSQGHLYAGEALNFPSTARNLPDLPEGSLSTSYLFPPTSEKIRLAQASQSFNHNWSSQEIQAGPNPRLSYSLGVPIQLTGGRKIGLIAALNYANTYKTGQGDINTFDGSGQVAALMDQSFAQNINTGGLLNFSYVAPRTQISLRNLANFGADNNTIFRSGIGNFSDYILVKNTSFLYAYNRLYNSILSFKQALGDNSWMLNGSLGYSAVRRLTPDYRIASYTKTPDFDTYQLSLGDFFNSSTGRFASDLNENMLSGNLEVSKQIKANRVQTTLKAGVFAQNRFRSFTGRSFVYQGQLNNASENLDPSVDLSANHISGSELYLVEKTAAEIAYYEGHSQIGAGYVLAEQKLFDRLRAVYGLRYEQADIRISNQVTNAEISRIQQGSLLPSVNLAYSLSDKANLRASYYASLNRPEFRELAPFAFYVFDKNAEIRGNNQLVTATLNNFDIRYELFPSGNEIVSVGGFYKHINNPVEFGIDITQVFTTFTYQNELSAEVFGVELEVRKNLGFLAPTAFLQHTSIFGNASLIHSGLTFADGSQALKNRPLQGQSPYVLNAGLQYENKENGWFGGVVVNRVGRRIAFVGVDPKFGETRQDIFEAPRTMIDAQLGKQFGRLSLKATWGDILKQNLIYYQDINANGRYDAAGEQPDRLQFKYLMGNTLSLSASVSF